MTTLKGTAVRTSSSKGAILKATLRNFLTLFVMVGWSLVALAAIDPAALLPQEPLGFEIKAEVPGWELSTPPPDAKNVKRLFRGPASAASKSQPTLTVRIEPLAKEEKELRDYLRRWLKDYPKFGYNVLGHQPFKLDGRQAHVIDVVDVAGERQARQVVTVEGPNAILFTCLDQKQEFGKSLPACNTLIRSVKFK